MGRKRKTLSDEQKAQLEVMAAFLTVEQIADYFGIGKTSFYAMIERDPEISERYKKGKAAAIGSVAKTLVSQARDGNLTAAIFYLKTQGGWRENMVDADIDRSTQKAIEVRVIDARKNDKPDT